MTYRQQPLRAPRLAGLRLRLVAALADSWLFGGLVCALMRRQLGVPQIWQVTAEQAPRVSPEPVPRQPSPSSPPWEMALPEPPDNFLFECGVHLAARYRDGSVTPTQVAQRVLSVCRQSDAAPRPLRAFIAQQARDVLSQAEASTARYQSGQPLGPLDGVPVAIKDELDQRGYPTTVGTCFLGAAPCNEDATAVARLRAAGAVLVGKTNMHEIGIGVTGINPHHGSPRNPYQPEHVTGGSSSGSAAAVAAGLVPLALGADGGGSVRVPSAFNGILGLKPTFGRVSEQGAAPLCWSVAHVGPMAGTVADLALGYLTIAGPDPADENTWHQPAPHLHGLDRDDLSGVRIGVYRPWFEDADPDVVVVCEEALEAMCEVGAERVEIQIPEIELVRPAHMLIIATEMAAAHQRYRTAHGRAYGADVRLNLAIARSVSTIDYLQAQRVRRRICDNFATALRSVDLIATPMAACTAPRLRSDALRSGESDLVALDRTMRFATAGNLTGLPAISIPSGQDSLGLPIGLQLIGRHWDEHLLLACAAQLEPRIRRIRQQVRFSLLAELEMSVKPGWVADVTDLLDLLARLNLLREPQLTDIRHRVAEDQPVDVGLYLAQRGVLGRAQRIAMRHLVLQEGETLTEAERLVLSWLGE